MGHAAVGGFRLQHISGGFSCPRIQFILFLPQQPCISDSLGTQHSQSGHSSHFGPDCHNRTVSTQEGRGLRWLFCPHIEEGFSQEDVTRAQGHFTSAVFAPLVSSDMSQDSVGGNFLLHACRMTLL